MNRSKSMNVGVRNCTPLEEGAYHRDGTIRRRADGGLARNLVDYLTEGTAARFSQSSRTLPSHASCASSS